jgi:hypothetical protein
MGGTAKSHVLHPMGRFHPSDTRMLFSREDAGLLDVEAEGTIAGPIIIEYLLNF